MPVAPIPPRRYIILSTAPGESPWDLGPLENMKQVLGTRWWDWLIPLRHSPCCRHDSSESAYALGPVVTRLRLEAGLPTGLADELDESQRSTRTPIPDLYGGRGIYSRGENPALEGAAGQQGQ